LKLVEIVVDDGLEQFQTNPRGVEASDAKIIERIEEGFQTNPRGVEAFTSRRIEPFDHPVSDEPSWG